MPGAIKGNPNPGAKINTLMLSDPILNIMAAYSNIGNNPIHVRRLTLVMGSLT